jgi:hypothetical protein
MTNLPTPIKAALGLAAEAVEEVRKLPETLTEKITTVPMAAVSTAMQVSLRMQQRIAELAQRGEEVMARFKQSSAEPPKWAKFDDGPAPGEALAASKAAFDRIDFDHTGFDGAFDSNRWDAVGSTNDEGAGTNGRSTTLAEDLLGEMSQPLE